jgi:nitrogen regulatory protein P-II 1
MKEIKAFIHRVRIAEVLQALNVSGFRSLDERSGCRNICVSSVQSLVSPVEKADQHYSMELAAPVVREWKLELFCEDAQADQLVDIVRQAARIGYGVAGWIFVIDIVNAVPVTGVAG